MGADFYACVRRMLECLVLYTIIASSSLVLASSGDNCSFPCKCVSTTITCNNIIPAVVPDNITEVVIDEINTLVIYPGVFCNRTWNNVKILCLNIATSHFLLPNFVFNCLDHIQSLKISGIVFEVCEETFHGLTNVTDLDLSYTGMTNTAFHNLLYHKANLPKLTRLNLSNQQLVPWTVDQQFIDYLSTRPIQLLDFSHNSAITFDFQNASELCRTLNTFILHDSFVIQSKLPMDYCRSLQVVDLSGNPELSEWLKNCVYTTLNFSISKFYCAPKIRLDSLVTIDYHTKSCAVWFTCFTRVRELYFSNNFIPTFEILFDFRSTTQSVELVDLSNNNIKNINKNALAYIPTLKKVDLSHNKLGQMGDFEGVFSSLFLFQSNLLVVNLAFNELSHLPDNTFISNSNMTEIILAFNNFEQLSLNVTHLFNLRVLDLRFNKMQYLNRRSMELVDKLHKTRNGSHRLQVLLEGNPFTCSCQALAFLRWFVTSPIYNSSYTCYLDGDTVSMAKAAVRAAQEDCERPKRRLMAILSSTLTPVLAVAVSAAAGVILYKQYKRRIEQQMLQDRLRLIQEDQTGFKFTVFLSYCDQDAEFVVEHIRQPLEKHLQSLTKTQKDHVCAGDHITPGHPVLPGIERLLAEAAVFVAVVSESYCNNYFCQAEVSEAQDTNKPIILIFKEQIRKGAIGAIVKNVFKSYVRAEIVQDGDGYQIYPDWEKICKIIVGQIKIQDNQNDPFAADTE